MPRGRPPLLTNKVDLNSNLLLFHSEESFIKSENRANLLNDLKIKLFITLQVLSIKFEIFNSI